MIAFRVRYPGAFPARDEVAEIRRTKFDFYGIAQLGQFCIHIVDFKSQVAQAGEVITVVFRRREAATFLWPGTIPGRYYPI